ncbi:MAG: 23S rRNA (pseudouridine(1915)-N(3))-methyltransferase RlmH [Candidatus Zixiibacteriota bacterium]|nr:MAG: 23S rRNA (pseudouridine(1915)-N(3))-methyltransferase RlmH [candidate division Zixibacteria bacterium]
MFKINIIALGKNKEGWVDWAVAHYLKLLKKYAAVELVYIPDVKKSKNLPETEIRRKEARLIENRSTSKCRVALWNKGRRLDSVGFAEYLSNLMLDARGPVDFIIGGVCGLDESLLESCDETISLSPMTLSHQIVRPVLLEQLYRALSILAGDKYHK